MNRLIEIYKLLLKNFGKQGWWPLTEKGEVKPEHNGKNPVSDNEKFEIVTGAILTQNTNWKNVEKALDNLRQNKALNPESIKKLKSKRLAELVKSSGYHNQKAKKFTFQTACQVPWGTFFLSGHTFCNNSLQFSEFFLHTLLLLPAQLLQGRTIQQTC